MDWFRDKLEAHSVWSRSEVVDSDGHIHVSKDLSDHCYHPVPLQLVQPTPDARHAEFSHPTAYTVVSQGTKRGGEGVVGRLVEVANLGHLEN